MNSPGALIPFQSPQVAPTPAAEDAFMLESDAVHAAFGEHRLYPVALSPASVYDAAVQLYSRWLDIAGAAFEADAEPWLPIGRVGPLLVLGHYNPARAAFLPEGWFQPVLLRRVDYDRHRRLCGPVIATTRKAEWHDGDFALPRRAFPEAETKLIRPVTLRAALRFLIEYFPHRQADLEVLHEVLAAPEDIKAEILPAGYFGACWALMQEGAVADITAVAPPEALLRRVPSDILGRIRLISEYRGNVWVGVTRLPQPDLEDMLLNELGDGWCVHFALLDGPRGLERTRSAEPQSTARARDEGEDKPGGRPRVKIADARTRGRAGDNQSEPGVIRLTQKDVRELESYNARRPDRDPLKVFLKELSAGVRHGATDLHIEVGLESYRIRARIDGYLEEWLEMPLEFGRMVVGAAKEQFGLAPERWMPQDGACTVHHGSDIVNLRVAAYPIRGSGQKLAIRFLPRRGDVPPLNVLMPAREAALMRRSITRPYGLILLCGPTGSGKTTTTFSALAEINQPDVNITTMEDPVEYEMDGVNQAELDKSRAVEWNVLLSGFLRQDPDVGMVGEIRDRETAETAIRLTLTGHIVLATLHTMSCAHTVERLVDTGVNPQMFANAATLIVSQRLVRRLCARCKNGTRRAPTEAEQNLFRRHDIAPPAALHDPKPAGCPECRGTGYKGQVGAFEMLPVTDEVSQLIAEKRPVRAIEEWMRAHEFPRVYQSALNLVARGETTLAEANLWQAVWDDLPPPAATATL